MPTHPIKNEFGQTDRRSKIDGGSSLLRICVAILGLLSFGTTCLGQPIFRTPQATRSFEAIDAANATRGMAPIRKVAGTTAKGQFQLPQLGSPTLNSPNGQQEKGFENSTLREVGSAGEFLPQQDDVRQRTVEIEMPEFDLGALGIVDPSAASDQDVGGGLDGDSLEQLPLTLGQSENDPSADSSGETNVIRREKVVENYPDGSPRLIRSVAMDRDGNYFNDGPWVVKSRDGKTIAAGRYKRGVMHGQWGRRHVSSEGGLFATKPFTLFQEPFDSIANFDEGKLDGQWAIYDRSKRTVFEINYDQGKRDGSATWFYPDTTRMRSATFKEGVLHGEISEWDEDGRLTSKDYYHEGRKLVRNTSFYRPKVPKEEAYYLDVKLEQDGFDNWWEAKPAPYVSSGQRVQAGQARAWYSNQQLQYRGQFRDDKPVGQFFWWHENGNRSTVGQFDRDGNRTGKWIWWHENGLKQIEGSYRVGQPAGTWRSWDEDGQLVKSKSYDADRESVDPIESIESILDLPDTEADDDSAGEKGSSPVEPETKNTNEPAAEPANENSELPLPSSAQPPKVESESGEDTGSNSSEAEVRESLGPPLDESLLRDEEPSDDAGVSTSGADAKTKEAEAESSDTTFSLNDLLGGQL